MPKNSTGAGLGRARVAGRLDDLDIDIVHRLLQSEAPGLLYAAGARVPA